MIMGMPGETLASWKKGLETLAYDTKIDSIYIYNCTVLPNAPMNEPSFRDFYKIKTVRSPIYLPHASIHEDEEIKEYEYITVSSSTFTLDDLKKSFFYSWLILTYHSLGIFEHISKYYNKTHGLKFMDFYDIFLEYCSDEKSIFSNEYDIVLKYIDAGYAGKGWDHSDPKLGDIYWTIEEASWLRLVYNKIDLVENIENFLKYLEKKLSYNTSSEILNDLIKFQIFLLTMREDNEEVKSESFNFNWKDFLVNNAKLTAQTKNYHYRNLISEKDPIQWAYKTIWYGRYSSKFKFHPEFLEETKTQMQITQNISN